MYDAQRKSDLRAGGCFECWSPAEKRFAPAAPRKQGHAEPLSGRGGAVAGAGNPPLRKPALNCRPPLASRLGGARFFDRSPTPVARKVGRRFMKMLAWIKKLLRRRKPREQAGPKPVKRRRNRREKIPDNLVPIEEFGAYWEVDSMTLLRWSQMGLIAPVKHEGRWFITREAAAEFEQKAREGTFTPRLAPSTLLNPGAPLSNGVEPPLPNPFRTLPRQ